MLAKRSTPIRLPEVRPFRTIPWDQGYGSDFYGALRVASRYCGLASVPDLFPGVWQHGCIPPWQQVQPEMCIYSAPRSLQCWVARRDEETYLREAGYLKAKAIGLPIIYTQPERTHRIPGSLLIMPMHAIPNDPTASDNDVYIQQLSQYRGHFSRVVACISGRCMDSGLWTRHFESAGIEVLRGATINDGASLSRIRRLCETFEFVTTNMYGSHIPYALHFGAKVSIWGWAEPFTREYLLRDSLWAMFPAAADRLASDDTSRRAEATLGRFRVPPHRGISDVALGSSLLGADNKLTPAELRDAFGWSRLRWTAANLRQTLWNRTPWPVQQLIRGARET